MKVGYITVHNVPSRIVTCGGWMDEAFTIGGHKEMVFIIPGNPGLTGYYEEFVQLLHDQLKIPVWILCHAGHEIQRGSDLPSVQEGTLLKNVRTTVHLIHPVILRHIFFLAAEEMRMIRDLDCSTVVQHSSKLKFYYGRKDGWCPLQYYHDLKQRLPAIDAVASTTDIRHAFVLNHSQEMANELSKWILSSKDK